jgi:hypothetical protein
LQRIFEVCNDYVFVRGRQGLGDGATAPGFSLYAAPPPDGTGYALSPERHFSPPWNRVIADALPALLNIQKKQLIKSFAKILFSIIS